MVKIFSMETLSAEFKPTASEKFELEGRQNKRTNSKFKHIQLINIPFSGTNFKIVPYKKLLKQYHRQFRPW